MITMRKLVTCCLSARQRISSIDRQPDGYRVRLDRGSYWFRVSQRALRNRRADFRVGVFVRLGGIFRRGIVDVDVVDWPDYSYGNDYYSNAVTFAASSSASISGTGRFCSETSPAAVW